MSCCPTVRVLEIGVGTGALAMPMAARGRRVVGVDLSAAMLGKLRDKDPDRTIPVVACDATRLPFGSRVLRRGVLPVGPASDRRLARRGSRAVPCGRPRRRGGRRARRILRGVALGVASFRRRSSGPWPSRSGSTSEAGTWTSTRSSPPPVAGCARSRPRRRASTAPWSGSSKRRSPGPTPGRGACPRTTCGRAVEVVRSWAIERYGPDLSRPFAADAPHRWRVYDLGG